MIEYKIFRTDSNMKIKVLKYCNDPLIDIVHLNTHKCRIVDEDRVEYFDFYTDATFPEDVPPEDLVGMTVEIEEMFAYKPFQFGRGVSVLVSEGREQ